MSAPVSDILARIVDQKQRELAGLDGRLDQLEKQGHTLQRRDFAAALLAAPPTVIAEVKKASPSRGAFVTGFDPAGIARAYEAGGAAAISVLTDAQFFSGALADLCVARTATRIPVLRKDFTIHRSQIAEAAAAGADAVLLIAAILTDLELRDFREYAEGFGMAALVEVHDEQELDRAAASGAAIIGVNNRDLRTFEVHLETSLRLADRMPTGVIRVSESGIRTAAHIARLRHAGYHAFLIGEHLMRSGDPARAIRELRQ